MTIFIKDKGNDSPVATFPLVIGPKSENHDAVEKIIRDDMQKLCKYKLPGILGGGADG